MIDRFFRGCGAKRVDVPVGIGDDGAVLECPLGKQLVAAIDTLVEGVHFPKGSPPASIGHRALAVNLSDLAAMGAEPAWALLALTLPSADEQWLTEFASGLDKLARAHNVALVGGDTTSGPLTITVQVLGFIEPTRALKRVGGSAGDMLFVSGTPGDAAGGLALELNPPSQNSPSQAYLRDRFLFPTPRVDFGRHLRDFATACIDVSDGLLGDANKLAQSSGCGAEIDFDALPVSPALVDAVSEHRARELALSGGDDYELCFAVSASRVQDMLSALPPEKWGYTRIGVLKAERSIEVVRKGTVMRFSHSGFDHFAGLR